jgi:hypothetical protein
MNVGLEGYGMREAIKLTRMSWAEHAARMGKLKNAHTILDDMTEGKNPLARFRRT